MNTFFFHLVRRGIASCLALWLGTYLACAADNEVIAVSPNWNGIREEIDRAFSAWHREHYGAPATVRWREVGGGGAQIIRFLLSEYKTSNSAGIDVLYGGGVDPYRDLKKRGLLTPYDPPAEILANIPATLDGMEIMDPDHEWFATALSGFGILTNEKAREAAHLPSVRAWADLTDPRLLGWISASDPRASSSAMQIYEIILQSYGWEKGWAILMAMSGNVRHFLSSSAASAVEVGVGNAAYGVAVDVYGNAQSGYYGPDNVSFVLPQGQTMISPDAIAILKNPPHPEMARRFVEFILSREGQLLFMLPKGTPGGARHYAINRMSVRPALYGELTGKTPIATDPFTQHSTFVYNNQLGSKRRQILAALIAASMIDTHDDMVRAWKALHSPAAQKLPAERRQKLLDEFLSPPCSEEELLRLVGTDWTDPIKRTALINRWQGQALDRYKNLLAQIGSN